MRVPKHEQSYNIIIILLSFAYNNVHAVQWRIQTSLKLSFGIQIYDVM